jgi:hypothetical protein
MAIRGEAARLMLHRVRVEEPGVWVEFEPCWPHARYAATLRRCARRAGVPLEVRAHAVINESRRHVVGYRIAARVVPESEMASSARESD